MVESIQGFATYFDISYSTAYYICLLGPLILGMFVVLGIVLDTYIEECRKK